MPWVSLIINAWSQPFRKRAILDALTVAAAFDDCVRKFRDCAKQLRDEQIDRLIELIGRLEQINDIREVIQLLSFQ